MSSILSTAANSLPKFVRGREGILDFERWEVRERTSSQSVQPVRCAAVRQVANPALSTGEKQPEDPECIACRAA